MLYGTAILATATYGVFNGIRTAKPLENIVISDIELPVIELPIIESPSDEQPVIEIASIEYAMPVLSEPLLPVFESEDNEVPPYQLPENEKTEKVALALADALYLEGRGVHEKGANIPSRDYLEMIAGSVVERTVKGWRGAEGIEDTLGRKSQYSFTNESNPQNEISTKVKDHASQNIIDKHAYEKCLETATDVVRNGSDSDIDHFYVDSVDGKNTPKWAMGKVPVKIFNHRSFFRGKVQDCITRGYNFL